MAGMEPEHVANLLFSGFISLAFQVSAVVLGVVIAWRWLHRHGGLAGKTSSQTEKSPMEILDERFARGEIDAQELEARRRHLLRQDRHTG
jgi:uncharacterized membrane protein